MGGELVIDRLAAVACELAPGMFSSEVVFAVRMADSALHYGVAPVHFCWDSEGEFIQEGELNSTVSGKVAVRVVNKIDTDQYAVELPDGEVVAVRREAIMARPKPVQPPGATDKESEPHVPLRAGAES